MNRTDLFVCAVTQVVEPFALARTLDLLQIANRLSATAHLARGPHQHVLTPRYELTPGRTGVTGRSDIGSVAEISWSEIARLLEPVATPDRVGHLSRALEAEDPFPDAGSGQSGVEAVQHDIAHAAAVAGGLLRAPNLSEADGAIEIQLRSTTHWTTAYVNRVEIASIRPVQHTASVMIPGHFDHDSATRAPGFDSQVLFVPPGDSNAPTASMTNRRVGVERLDPDNHDGARWAIQIDGFDTLIVDASDRGRVQVSVYDHDPDQPFMRFTKSLPIPPPTSAAERRLSNLSCSRSGRSL